MTLGEKLKMLRAICTYFAVTTDYIIWENEEDTPKAAVPEKERAAVSYTHLRAHET